MADVGMETDAKGASLRGPSVFVTPGGTGAIAKVLLNALPFTTITLGIGIFVVNFERLSCVYDSECVRGVCVYMGEAVSWCLCARVGGRIVLLQSLSDLLAS